LVTKYVIPRLVVDGNVALIEKWARLHDNPVFPDDGGLDARRLATRGAIHQMLNIIFQLRILVLLLVSTLPCVVKAKNYS
jgi:hypothetical protein